MVLIHPVAPRLGASWGWVSVLPRLAQAGQGPWAWEHLRGARVWLASPDNFLPLP